MSLIQCMGGWCGSREKCAHYHAHPLNGRQPVDRLCGDEETPEPLREIVVNFPKVTDEKTHDQRIR